MPSALSPGSGRGSICGKELYPTQRGLWIPHGPGSKCLVLDAHLVPVHFLHVHQDPHELRDGKGWVGVVQLDGNLQYNRGPLTPLASAGSLGSSA